MADRGRSEGRREQLHTLLDRLSQELISIESELTATRAVRANGSDDDEHDPDGIPLSSVLQGLEGQKVRLVAEFREAERAQTELEQGRYGICQRCGRAIPAARLEIKPTTRTCVACAR